MQSPSVPMTRFRIINSVFRQVADDVEEEEEEEVDENASDAASEVTFA